jgi:hypothetical protein
MKKLLIGLTLLASMSSFAGIEVICGDSDMKWQANNDSSTKHINNRLKQLEEAGNKVEVINFTSNLTQDDGGTGHTFHNRECMVVKY